VHRPDRHRQHAGPVDLRADPGARTAASRRDGAPPAQTDDPLGVGDHHHPRRRARPRGGSVLRMGCGVGHGRHRRRPAVVPRLPAADVRGRGRPGRRRGRHLPGPAGGQARRAARHRPRIITPGDTPEPPGRAPAPAGTFSLNGMLAARDVTVMRGPRLVLERVDLSVDAGSRIGVLGRNGAGKSTLLRVLAGLEVPTSGRVERAPAALTVGYLTQEVDPLDGETTAQYRRRRTGLAGAEAALDHALAVLERASGPAELAAYDAALAGLLALGGDD